MRAAAAIACLSALCAPGAARACDGQAPRFVLSARVIAVGIPGIAGIRQVGMFHRGGPIPGNPEFLMKTRPGRVLDPERILVTSNSNFGAPLAHATQRPGSILSIDPKQGNTLIVPQRFAADGGQSIAAGGAIRLYTAQQPQFLNAKHNAGAPTAAYTAASAPRYISANQACGR